MRVIAGDLGGRRLRAPDGTAVRPTSDRVREAVFNALGSLGAVEGARVLDLFAGTGALGIEALSRGASHGTFVERDRAVREVLVDNLAVLDLDDRSTVVAGDALGNVSGHYDLALLDPPYGFEGWSEVLGALDASVAVIESGESVAVPARWRVVRERRYGGTLVMILVPSGDET